MSNSSLYRNTLRTRSYFAVCVLLLGSRKAVMIAYKDVFNAASGWYLQSCLH